MYVWEREISHSLTSSFSLSLSHTHTAVTHPSRQWISHRGSFAWGVGTMDGTGVTSCPAWWVVSECVWVCVSTGVVSIPFVRVKRLLPLSTPASWVSIPSIHLAIPVLLYLPPLAHTHSFALPTTELRPLSGWAVLGSVLLLLPALPTAPARQGCYCPRDRRPQQLFLQTNLL